MDFKNYTLKETYDHIEKITEGDDIDMTKRFNGIFTVKEDVTDYIRYGFGFSKKTLKVGDKIILNTNNGVKAKLLIIDIKKESDPKDMFLAYTVNI